MGVLNELVWAALHLACTAIDMMFLLVLFRAIGKRWQVTWVQTINDAARGVVDRFIRVLRSRWNRWTSSSLSEAQTLALCVVTLAGARLLLCTMAGCLLL